MPIDYNDETTWVDPELHEAPAFGVSEYQKKIDEICGLNEFGGPNVLLTWMPAIENYSRYFCEWGDAGFGTKTELRALYVFTTLDDDKGHQLEIPPPRWALKQFIHPAQYLGHEERLRWRKRYGNGENQIWVQEIRPPRPDKGFYGPMIAIGSHNGFCCRAAKKEKRKCWGDYRKPDESYLIWLREAVETRAERGEERPDAGFTPKLLKMAAKEAAETIERRERLADAQMDELIDSNLDSMLAYYLNDKSFLEGTKEFSFPTGNKGGIIVPRLN